MAEGVWKSMGAAVPAPAMSEGDEARVLWRMRRRVMRTLLRQMLDYAWLRVVLTLVLSLFLWVGLFGLFLDGFHFLKAAIGAPDTHDQLLRALFGIFFASLMVMLTFSSGIILYGLLFRSAEATFLLTLPIRAERVFLHKFQEAILFSCWGFVLLGSPVLLAFGIVARAPWYYYALLLPLVLGFVYIPASIGAMICMWVVRRAPRRRMWVAAAAGIAACGLATWLAWSVFATPESSLITSHWLQEMMRRLRFTDQRFLPSWWLSCGLMEAARGEWFEGLMFTAVTVSNALLFRQLAIWLAGAGYRSAYDAMHSVDNRRRRARTTWFDRPLTGLGRWLPSQLRLLMVKDLRLFYRDPLQWSQFTVFFGLLLLYFVNMRRFRYDVMQVTWVNFVSFLNVSVIGLLLSTFNTRFVFPMISLEGRRLWILGLLPVRRDTILWGKFLFAALGSIVPSAGLIALSDLTLRIPPVIVASHQLTCVLLSVGLAGIAVGLGAKLPNLREQSPSRIAAGFGGTLCLVVGTTYIVLIVLLTAVPCHFGLAMGEQHLSGDPFLSSLSRHFQWWLLAGTVGSLALAAIATIAPLWIGYRAFRRLEF